MVEEEVLGNLLVCNRCDETNRVTSIGILISLVGGVKILKWMEEQYL
jgi:hypothetical protein